MPWGYDIQDASFGGVAFQFQSLEDELTTRRIVEHKYPYRDGADLEDLGRDTRTTKIRAVFFGDQFLSDLNALLAQIDEGKSKEFVHPQLGRWQAMIRRSPIHQDSSAYFMAVVELEILEDCTDTALPSPKSVLVEKEEVEKAAAEVEALNEDDDSLITDAINEATSLYNKATSAIGSINNIIDRARDKINKAVNAYKRLTDIKSWAIVRGLKKLSHTCQNLGSAIRDTKPPVISKSTDCATSASVLAHKRYGDYRRQDEIIKLNRIRNSFVIPAGTKLNIFSK